MKLIANTLIVLGVIIIICAFNMDVKLPGADVVNFNLISSRQNYIIFGSVILLAGIILFATTKFNTYKSDNVIDATAYKIKNNATTYIGKVYNYENLYKWLFLCSILLTIISFFMPWTYDDSMLTPEYHYIHSDFIFISLALYAYPIIKIVKNKNINALAVILCSVALLFNLYVSTKSGLAYDEPKGIGPKIAMLAAILYIIGAIKIPKFITPK